MQSQTLIQISQIDASLVMYIFGVVFGVISILYFARDILVSLSVTIKSMVLYSTAILIFSGSLFVGSNVISIILVIFCGFTYTSATIYVWKTYQLEKVGRFLVLAVSSVLLLSVGRSLQTDIFTDVDGTTSVLITGIIPLLITLILSVIDTLEDSPITYHVTFEDRIENLDDTNESLGCLKIKNSSYFRRKYKLPRLSVELSNNRNTNLPSSYQNNILLADVKTIKSGETLSTDIVLSPDRLPDRAEVDVPDSFDLNVLDEEDTNFKCRADEDIRVKLIEDE